MDKLTTLVASTRGPPPKDGSRLGPGSHFERCDNKNTPTAGNNFVLPQAISRCFAAADGTKRRAVLPVAEEGRGMRAGAGTRQFRTVDACPLWCAFRTQVGRYGTSEKCQSATSRTVETDLH